MICCQIGSSDLDLLELLVLKYCIHTKIYKPKVFHALMPVLLTLDGTILVDDFSALKKIIQKFWDGGSIFENLNGGITLVNPPESSI